MTHRRRKGDPMDVMAEVDVQAEVELLTQAVTTFASLDMDAMRQLAVEIGGVSGVRLSRLVALAGQMVSTVHSTVEAAAMQTRLDVIVGGGDEVEVRAHYGLPDNVRVLCPRREERLPDHVR